MELSERISSYDKLDLKLDSEGDFPLEVELNERVYREGCVMHFGDAKKSSIQCAVKTETDLNYSENLDNDYNDNDDKLHTDIVEEINRRESNVNKMIMDLNHIAQKKKYIPLEENCKCSLHCFERISEDEKTDIYNNLIAYKTKNEQDTYLQDLIQTRNILRKRPRKAEPRPRSTNFKYSVLAFNRRISVCKNAFMILHRITKSRVRRLCCLLYLGLPPVDMRGKCSKKTTDFMENLTDGSVINEVHLGEGAKSVDHFEDGELEKKNLLEEEVPVPQDISFKHNRLYSDCTDLNSIKRYSENSRTETCPKEVPVIPFSEIVHSDPRGYEIVLSSNDTHNKNSLLFSMAQQSLKGQGLHGTPEVDAMQDEMKERKAYSDKIGCHAEEIYIKKVVNKLFSENQERNKRGRSKRRTKFQSLGTCSQNQNFTPAWLKGHNCKCSLQCFEKISKEEQIGIYNNLAAFKTKNEQDMYLQDLIQTWHILRKRPRSADPRPRSTNFRYCVIAYNRRIPVCKKAFMLFHGISEGRVRRLCCLLYLGLPPIDMRGRTPKKAPQSITNVMEDSALNEDDYSGTETSSKPEDIQQERIFVKEEPVGENETSFELNRILPLSTSIGDAAFQADRLCVEFVKANSFPTDIKKEDTPSGIIIGHKNDSQNLNGRSVIQRKAFDFDKSRSNHQNEMEIETLSSAPNHTVVIDEIENMNKLHMDISEAYERGKVEEIEITDLQSAMSKGNCTPSQIEDCKCSMQCFKKITAEEKVAIFNTVISYRTKNEQDMYLQKLIETQHILRKRPRSLDPRQRCSNFKYYVIAYDRKVCVCKKAFVNLHGATDSRVRRLCCLLYLGIVPEDKRGKNSSKNKVPGATRVLVRRHIESFPVKQECNAGIVYSYLENDLDVRKMHTMFLESHPNVSVSYSFYMRFFKENFSLTFGKPSKNK